MKLLSLMSTTVAFSLTSIAALGQSSAGPTLKEAARGLFHIGAAINGGQISGSDAEGAALAAQQFDSITPENVMKWERIHPEPGRYDLTLPDQYVAFGERHGMFIIGHTLMWHSQTPKWVFQNPDGSDISREALLERLREHIRTVVGRYRGKVKGWDVVNEAIDDTGKLRTDEPWYRILGEEGIFAAFAAAHEADPDAQLYYNDYALALPHKRAAVIALVKKIQARGLRIDGIGTQEHHLLEEPTAAEVEATIADLAGTGLKVHITELDVSMLPRPMRYIGADVSLLLEKSPELDPYREGLPAAAEKALTARYASLFAIYAKYHTAVERVTFWGVSDRDSWLNGWPIRGRTDYPLVFDRNLKPKPAFQAVIKALQAAKK